MAKNAVNIDEIITEANQDNLYYAWLIVLPNILEQELSTYDEVIGMWEAVKAYNRAQRKLSDSDIKRAEELTGFHIPYKNLDVGNIRSVADLKKVREKMRMNAMGLAFGTIGLGLYHESHFPADSIKRIFLNADLTLAEMERGVNSYEKLSAKLNSYGIRLERAGNHQNVITVSKPDFGNKAVSVLQQ